MTSKTEKDKTKQLQDKCQSVLNSLLRDEDNKYCVDCDSKGGFSCIIRYYSQQIEIKGSYNLFFTDKLRSIF